MKTLNISCGTFIKVNTPEKTYFVEQVRWHENESVCFVDMCTAKSVGNDIVVSQCTAKKSELLDFILLEENKVDDIDEAFFLAINDAA